MLNYIVKTNQNLLPISPTITQSRNDYLKESKSSVSNPT